MAVGCTVELTALQYVIYSIIQDFCFSTIKAEDTQEVLWILNTVVSHSDQPEVTPRPKDVFTTGVITTLTLHVALETLGYPLSFSQNKSRRLDKTVELLRTEYK